MKIIEECLRDLWSNIDHILIKLIHISQKTHINQLTKIEHKDKILKTASEEQKIT